MDEDVNSNTLGLPLDSSFLNSPKMPNMCREASFENGGRRTCHWQNGLLHEFEQLFFPFVLREDILIVRWTLYSHGQPPIGS